MAKVVGIGDAIVKGWMKGGWDDGNDVWIYLVSCRMIKCKILFA